MECGVLEVGTAERGRPCGLLSSESQLWFCGLLPLASGVQPHAYLDGVRQSLLLMVTRQMIYFTTTVSQQLRISVKEILPAIYSLRGPRMSLEGRETGPAAAGTHITTTSVFMPTQTFFSAAARSLASQITPSLACPAGFYSLQGSL